MLNQKQTNKQTDTCPQKAILLLHVHRPVPPLVKRCSSVDLGMLCTSKLDVDISTMFRQPNKL